MELPMLRAFPRVTRSTLVRVAADALLVNAALVAGLFVRAIGMAMLGDGGRPESHLSVTLVEIWSFYVHAAVLLTAIALATFASSGFYTRGRYYTSRYKAVVILQSVTLAYVLFGYGTAFLDPAHPHPRSSLVVAWLTTLAALLLARLWSSVWRTLV